MGLDDGESGLRQLPQQQPQTLRSPGLGGQRAARGSQEERRVPGKPAPSLCLPPPCSAYCYSELRRSLDQRESCIRMCKESCK